MIVFFKIIIVFFLLISLFGFFFTKKFLEVFYKFNTLYYKICGINVQFKTITIKKIKILYFVIILLLSVFYYYIEKTISNNDNSNIFNITGQNSNTTKENNILLLLKKGGAIKSKIKRGTDNKIYIQNNNPIYKKDIDTVLQIKNKDFLDVVFNRNTCYFFKYGPEIPDEHIQLMLRAAMSSPSGYDLRSWCFVVVKEKKLIEDLISPIMNECNVGEGRLHANVIFVVCAKEKGFMNFGTDQLLSSVFLWLCAEYLNYAAALVDIFPDPDNSIERVNLFREKLSIPEDITPFYMILVGYYDRDKRPINKFDISNIHYNSWNSTTNNKVEKKDKAEITQTTNKENIDMKTVYDFLKKCKTYYLATVENDQPRVRPFGTIDLFENKLYIQTGKVKKVSKQMTKNPKIEICAFDDDDNTWIRIEATAVNDDNPEAKQHMLDNYPGLKRIYNANDNNTQVLYLKDATATFYSFKQEPKVVKF